MITNGRGFVLDEGMTPEEQRAAVVAARLLGIKRGDWYGRGIRRDDNNYDRIVWAPEGELDYIVLPSLVERLTSGPFGVVIQCADGIYLLTSDSIPEETKDWRVLKLL